MDRRAFLAAAACTAACAITPPRAPAVADLLAAIERSSPLRALAHTLSHDELAREEGFLRDAMQSLVIAATVTDPNDPLARRHLATMDRAMLGARARLAQGKPVETDRVRLAHDVTVAFAASGLELAPNLLDEMLRHRERPPLLGDVDRELSRARLLVPAQVPTAAAKMPTEEIRALRDRSVLVPQGPPPKPTRNDGELQSAMATGGAGLILLLIGLPLGVLGLFSNVLLLVAGGTLAAIGVVLLLVGAINSIVAAARPAT